MQAHTELPINLIAQIDQAPADHLVLLQRRTLADPRRNRRLLLRRQLARRRTPLRRVRKTRKATLVVPMHPVTQRLPVHASGPRRLAPVVTIHDQGKGQHPPRRRRILAVRRRRA